MITKLLLGTGNSAKLGLYEEFFKGTGIELVTAKDLGITEEPEENGETLEDNALIKAKYYFEKTGIPTLADDAGFEIYSLNNFPGVKSRRFAGRDLTDQEVIDAILEKMKDLEGDDRKARMRVACALVLGKDQVYVASGSLEGHVPKEAYEKRHPKMPYRSLLFVDSLNKWFEDITKDDPVGYRKAAVEEIKKYLI